MIKIIQSNPEKIQKSLILFMPFFGYLFLRHLLPYLLTFARKGCTEKRNVLLGTALWGLSLITGIPDHCPDHTVYKVPFTFLIFRALLFSSFESTQNAVSELCRKEVACETRMRAALTPLTHWHASEAKRNG